MHFHLPKPLHGWREFAGEVGVIVLGVLIALAAEQVVESIHWDLETSKLRESLHREIRDNLTNAAYRVMISPCIRERIQRLDAELRSGPGAWSADAVTSSEQARWGALPVAFNVPWEFYTTGHWQTTLASSGSEHMSEDERNGYSYAYRAIEDLRSYAVQENELASRLQPLAQDQQLDGNQRLAFESDLSSLDRLNVLETVYSRKFLEGNRRAGIVPRRASLDSALLRAREDYGSCALPLGPTTDAFAAKPGPAEAKAAKH